MYTIAEQMSDNPPEDLGPKHQAWGRGPDPPDNNTHSNNITTELEKVRKENKDLAAQVAALQK